MPVAMHKQGDANKAGLPAVLGAILALLVCAWFGFQHLALPVPVAAVAPPAEFSAARAALSVGRIARQAHPTGTVENDEVRVYLLDALRKLGLEPEVQSGVSLATRAHAAGMVHNIVVRLPGARPGKALLLAAHYDSAPLSPGAADNGASVAAILETLRALKSGAPLQNDIVCVLTDGEEVALLGARLFMQEHRLARRIGMAINFDYRGNSGPVWLFETGAGNAEVIDGFARAVPLPLGNSLMNEMYRFMPNDTDLTIFKRAGIPALNFAAGEGYTSYHTALDLPQSLNPGTLQHTGDIMLALARHFGNAGLGEAAAHDSIYADVPLAGMVNYSHRWLAPLFLLSALLLLAAGAAAKQRNAIRIGHTVLGAPVFLALVLLLALACQLAWRAVLLVHPDYQLILHGTSYNSHWYLLFFAAFAAGLFLLVQRQLARWFRPCELALAAMLVWVAALGCVSMAVPGASFILTWPLLPMLLALNVLSFGPLRKASGALKLAVLVAGAAPGVMLLPPLIGLIYDMLTPALVWVPMLVLLAFLGILIPVLDACSAPLALRCAPLLLAAACLVMAAASSGFDARHPRPNNLSYVQPQDGAALWASTDAQLDSWTGSFFPTETKQRTESAIFGQSAPPQWLALAPALGVEVPSIEVSADQVTGSRRFVTLAIGSPRRAPRIGVAVEGVKVLKSRVQGKLYAPEDGEKWRVDTFGMQAAPLRIELEMAAGNGFRIWARDYSYGLPATGMRARPADMMGQPFRNSDTVQAVSSMLVQAIPTPGRALER